MSKSEQQIEQEIQGKGLNAPRLTPDHIDSKIKAVEYILPREVCKRDNGVEIFDAPLSLQTLTFCVLTLENGFTVTGESSCASPENFDAEIGRKIAFENARNKIWMLEGYLLKQRLHEATKNQSVDGQQENTNQAWHTISTDQILPFIESTRFERDAENGKYLCVIQLTDNSTVVMAADEQEEAHSQAIRLIKEMAHKNGWLKQQATD